MEAEKKKELTPEEQARKDRVRLRLRHQGRPGSHRRHRQAAGRG